jgi:hypothetical protein
MLDPKVEAKFDGSNWVDISSDVMAPVYCSSGIMGNSPTDRVANPGRCTFALKNSVANSAGLNGYYSPGHANCRTGFAPGIKIRVRFTFQGKTRTKWYGTIAPDGIVVEPDDHGTRRTFVTAYDWMYQATVHTLYLPSYTTNKRMDEVMPLIVANMPIAPLSTSYATGQDTFPSVFDTVRYNTTAMSEFQKLAMSELGYVYLKHNQNSDEILVSEDRLFRNNVDAITSIPLPTNLNDYLVADGPNPNPEIILNGGLEATTGGDFDNWTRYDYGGSSAIATGAGEFHSGTKAVKLTTGTTNYASGFLFQYRGVSANSDYTLEFYTRGDGTNAGQYQVHDGTHYVNIVAQTTTGVAGTTYSKVSVNFTTPAGCTSVGILVYSPPIAYAVAYFDDISLKLYADPGLDYLTNEDGDYSVTSDTKDISLDNAMSGLDYTNGANLANRILVMSYPKKIDAAATTVLFTLQNQIEIAPQETITGINGTFRDPTGGAKKVAGKDMVIPVKNTDYWMESVRNSGTKNMSDDLVITATYGTEGVEYTLHNDNAAIGYVFLQARGRGIYIYDPVSKIFENTASINTHGTHELLVDLKYQDDPKQADVFGLTWIGQYSEPVSRASSATFYTKNEDMESVFFYADCGDLATIKENQTAINSDYFINGWEFSIVENSRNAGGNLVAFKWYLKKASLDTYLYALWDTLGTWSSKYGWAY